jgi:hypothetical protein
MMHLAYNCKFCGQSGFVDYEDNGILTEDQVANWLKYVACDRCATWHRSRSALCQLIYQSASVWSGIVAKTPDMPTETRRKQRDRFQALLTRLCEAVEKFKKTTGVYQSQFADYLLDDPQHASRVVNRILQS